jgi:hypothetical protein
LGINLESFDIGSIDEGDFYVKFWLRNKADGFYWVLVAVYGAAQAEHKDAFLSELVQTWFKGAFLVQTDGLSCSMLLSVAEI